MHTPFVFFTDLPLIFMPMVRARPPDLSKKLNGVSFPCGKRFPQSLDISVKLSIVITMTSDEKENLKHLLEKEIDAADHTIERLKEASLAVAPDNALGRLTRMETMGDQQMSKAKLYKMQERRVELRNALRRLPSPTFGLCNGCKQPLSVDRLLAVPEAQVCVPCLNKIRARLK